ECVLAPFFKMLEALFDLVVPVVMASVINVGIKDHKTDYILRSCGLLAVLAAVSLVCSVIAQYFAAEAAVGCATEMRHDLFSHIQSLGFSEMDRVG
ncbi:ABC transporter ATP-binding protein, partial [Flavobacterium sp. 17A]